MPPALRARMDAFDGRHSSLAWVVAQAVIIGDATRPWAGIMLLAAVCRSRIDYVCVWARITQRRSIFAAGSIPSSTFPPATHLRPPTSSNTTSTSRNTVLTTRPLWHPNEHFPIAMMPEKAPRHPGHPALHVTEPSADGDPSAAKKETFYPASNSPSTSWKPRLGREPRAPKTIEYNKDGNPMGSQSRALWKAPGGSEEAVIRKLLFSILLGVWSTSRPATSPPPDSVQPPSLSIKPAISGGAQPLAPRHRPRPATDGAAGAGQNSVTLENNCPTCGGMAARHVPLRTADILQPEILRRPRLLNEPEATRCSTRSPPLPESSKELVQHQLLTKSAALRNAVPAGATTEAVAALHTVPTRAVGRRAEHRNGPSERVPGSDDERDDCPEQQHSDRVELGSHFDAHLFADSTNSASCWWEETCVSTAL
ncbi:hypothetical protein CPLU01_15434 [Colletotrichum plurivorum]|uniref:Uncharacterized protein n=1 Tax=Colletotrichum plurivorum TaxID=2175906 RepID=A0A8H6MVI6_9PEZI|nr:hypothetical protein CPLU01_15434 [Colletotrichum plurivorum]